MGYNDEENIGVEPCNLTTFFETLEGQLMALTGLIPQEVLDAECVTLWDIRRPNLVIGDPGIGKTCGIASVINKINAKLPPEKQLGFKKLMLGRYAVGSLTGIPVVDPATGKVKREVVPDLPCIDKNDKEYKEYGVLFLDEITTVDDAQVQPALGLTDDTRSVGATYTLPEHWIVVASGNGPQCANFLKLDDMTLSRFNVFDVKYSYQQDWRPWAQANKIDNLIIAFLNFKPEYIVQTVSEESDRSGKQFACPRTWTRLSKELSLRRALGRPVGLHELSGFASRIIGIKAATDFQAFAQFSQKLTIDPDDIINGKVKECPNDLDMEAFHILVQSLVRKLLLLAESYGEIPVGSDYPDDAYIKVGNVLRFIVSVGDLFIEQSVSAITQLNHEVPYVNKILVKFDKFEQYCPEFIQFLDDHIECINGLQTDVLM